MHPEHLRPLSVVAARREHLARIQTDLLAKRPPLGSQPATLRAYLMTVMYRDDHDLSAPHDITHYKSLVDIADRLRQQAEEEE